MGNGQAPTHPQQQGGAPPALVEYVLVVSSDEGVDAPFALYREGKAEPLAIHPNAFDTGPILVEGVAVKPASCLTAAGLLDQTTIQSVGSELWRRLTPGAIQVALTARPENSVLYLDLPPELLSAYPWELVRREEFWVAMGLRRVCLGVPRATPKEYAGRPPDSDHPLRVLVLLGIKPDDDTILAEEELLAIEAAAHHKNEQVLLRTLLQPGSAKIQEAIRVFRPHVFHFIGHGYAAGPEVPPEIQVWNGKPPYDSLTAERIRQIFPTSPPRLVVLNACLTGKRTMATTSLVSAFLDAGSIAVVSMMGEIRGDSSYAFSETFYAELFAGAPVDVAAARARTAIANADGMGENSNIPAERSNWPLPRLVVAGDVTSAVTMTNAAPPRPLRWTREDFVVRWNERFAVCQAMDGTSSRFALVVGGQGIGKTELLNAIADICYRHGEKVLKVDVGGKLTGDSWRDVLVAIAKVAETDATDEVSRARATVLTTAARAKGQSIEVIRGFQAELAHLSDGEGVLVVIDGLGQWEENIITNTVLPELCGPYLDRSAPLGVRMVVTMRQDLASALQTRFPGWQATRLDQFQQDEWQRAVRHVKTYWLSKLPPQQHGQVVGMANVVAGLPMTGDSLRHIRTTAEQLQRQSQLP